MIEPPIETRPVRTVAPRVTLAHVADRAGVSTATASLILSRREEYIRQFRTDTVEKVRRSAKRLGYRANLFAPVQQATMNTWARDIMPSILNYQSGLDQATGGGTLERLTKGGQDLMTQMGGQLAGMQLQGLSTQAGALPADPPGLIGASRDTQCVREHTRSCAQAPGGVEVVVLKRYKWGEEMREAHCLIDRDSGTPAGENP